MKNILDILNKTRGVNAAALFISGAFLLSRLLGLLRDRLLIAEFGLTPQVDAYTAAFRLPELLFTLLVSGAFAVAFIPIAAAHIEKDALKKLRELASILLNVLVLATVILGVFSFVFADQLVSLITPGFDAYRHDLTVSLTRIMLVTPVMFAISSVFGSVAQSFGRFTFFALASVFYNIGIIIGIKFLGPELGIEGVAYGVVLGTLLQMLFQLIGLKGLGFYYVPSLNIRRKDVREVLELMVPRSLGQGMDQLYMIIETSIGSRLATGSLTALYYANNIKNLPLSLVGNSIATAAFPRLAATAARGAIKSLVDEFVEHARLILFLSLPAAALAIILRGYLVRLIYGFGDPTTATVLGWLAGTIVFEAFLFLVLRMFYALKDTRTPLLISLVTLIVSVFLSYGLSEVYGVAGLAMAQTIAVFVQVTVLMGLLWKRLGGRVGGWRIADGGYRFLVSTIIMSGLVYLSVSEIVPLLATDVGFTAVAPKVVFLGLVAAIGYLVPSYLLGVKEARQIISKLWLQVSKPLKLT